MLRLIYVVTMIVNPALSTPRATGTPISTPTDPDGEGLGWDRSVCVGSNSLGTERSGRDIKGGIECGIRVCTEGSFSV